MQVKKNSSLRGSRLALILIGPVLWIAVVIWPAVAHSQQETHRPTHYVIVVRNTAKSAGRGPDVLNREFDTAINAIPTGLAAASGQISLWRNPEPGDLVSVVFAAAEKDQSPSGQPGCDYPYFFDKRARFVVEEHDSPSEIADPSSKLHQKLLQNLVAKEGDLTADAYSECLTLAKGLAAVDVGDANGGEKYKQFFLLVLDFASPPHGSTEFNAMFDVSHEDPAPGTPAYFIVPIGFLKFADGYWSVDNVTYLNYPADKPSAHTPLSSGRGNKRKQLAGTGAPAARLRFYRAVALEATSDPFYKLADALQPAATREEDSKTVDETTNAFVAWSPAATFALLMVLVAWRWWAIKRRFRRMTAEYQKTLQQMREEESRLAENCERQLLQVRQALAEEFRAKQAAMEAEKEKLHSLLTSAVCIPDPPNTDRASESA